MGGKPSGNRRNQRKSSETEIPISTEAKHTSIQSTLFLSVGEGEGLMCNVPRETFAVIFLYIDTISLIRFASTCRSLFLTVANCNETWQYRCRAEFFVYSFTNQSETESWKQHYYGMMRASSARMTILSIIHRHWFTDTREKCRQALSSLSTTTTNAKRTIGPFFLLA